MILGIDPGLSGAYALFGDLVLVGDLPVHQAQHGRGAKVRVELDLHSLRELIAGEPVTHCFIERVGAMPKQGVTSMFRFGEAAGQIYGLMVGLRLPVTFVAPREWQKYHRIGPSRDAARQRAVQLHPQLVSVLARKQDHNRADALLLACYGQAAISSREPVRNLDENT